jgi:hypothetical protein
MSISIIVVDYKRSSLLDEDIKKEYVSLRACLTVSTRSADSVNNDRIVIS